MKIVVEKRPIVGEVRTRLGTFPMLSDRISVLKDQSVFNVLDEEGFDTNVVIHGEYVVVPSPLLPEVDVKRTVTDKEAENIPDLFDDGTNPDEVIDLTDDDKLSIKTFDLR